MVKPELKKANTQEITAQSVAAPQSFFKPSFTAAAAPKGDASRALIILAFAAVYLIWGSTYLAIKYAIGTMPPFLMAATRFLSAGALLFAWTSFRGKGADTGGRPSFEHWRRAFIIGALLLLCGNGGVTWAESYLPSGLTALLVASEPFWVVILNWTVGGSRPSVKVFLGLFTGLAGVALLVSGGFTGNASRSMSLVGAGVVIAAAFAWAAGSVYSMRRPIQASPSLASGMQMLAGGMLLLVIGLLTGEFRRFHISNVSWVSIGALVYLIVFGSIVAFTAYSWLLRKVAPARAATYAYVNPVVAVLLGWVIASEPLTIRTLAAAAVIVASVALITTYGGEEREALGVLTIRSNEEEFSHDLNRCANHPCA
jgi:drug/metabolite transporter (DMT)-like permease